MKKNDISKRQFLKDFDFDQQRLQMHMEDNTLIVGMNIKMIRIPKSLIDLTRMRGGMKSREYNHLSIVYALMISMDYEYNFDRYKFSVSRILDWLGYKKDTKNTNMIRNTIKILVERKYLAVIDDVAIADPEKLKPSKVYYVRANDNFKKCIYTSFSKLCYLRKSNVFNSRLVQLYNVYMEMLSYYYFKLNEDECVIATRKFFNEFTSIRDNDTKLKILCNLASMHLAYIKTGNTCRTNSGGLNNVPYFISFPMKSRPNFKEAVDRTLNRYVNSIEQDGGIVYDVDFAIQKKDLIVSKKRLSMLKKNNANEELIQDAEQEVKRQESKFKTKTEQLYEDRQYSDTSFDYELSEINLENDELAYEEFIKQADYFKSLGATMTKDQMKMKNLIELDNKLCESFRDSGIDIEQDEYGSYIAVDKTGKEAI